MNILDWVTNILEETFFFFDNILEETLKEITFPSDYFGFFDWLVKILEAILKEIMEKLFWQVNSTMEEIILISGHFGREILVGEYFGRDFKEIWNFI